MQKFVTSQKDNAVSCIIPSELAAIDKGVEFFLHFLDSKKITINHFEIRYVIREAINNAIIHGNRGNKDLHVKCTLEIDKNSLLITIIDEGKGFDWKRQLAKKHALSTAISGRGLNTISQYGFGIDFNDSGNTLYLRKKIM